MADTDFRQFAARERKRLVKFVSSMLTGAAEMDAEDIVQDVLLRLFERPQDITSLEFASAYVYRSLRNRVIDVTRVQKDNIPLLDDDDNPGLASLLADEGTTVVAVLQSAERREQLFTALASLSEIEQSVVIGHELEGRTFKEMSEIWQVSQNTLLSHKARALRKLKTYFETRNKP